MDGMPLVVAVAVLVLFVLLFLHLVSGGPKHVVADRLLVEGFRHDLERIRKGIRDPRLLERFLTSAQDESIRRVLRPQEAAQVDRFVPIAQAILRDRNESFW